jgi:Fe-S cluster assembly protein SufD
MVQVAERFDTYAADFEAFRESPGFGPEWLRTARAAAFARFLEQGFPTTKDEEWKFTNVAPIAGIEFRPVRATKEGQAPGPRVNRAMLEPFLFEDAFKFQAVVINGRLSSELSSLSRLPDGVTVTSLADAMTDQPPLEGPSLKSDHAFVLLNTAFCEGGIFVHVAPKVVMTEPIHVLFVSAPGDSPTLVAPRLFVVVGEQSQSAVVESYVGLGDSPVLTTAVTEVLLGPGSMVDHVKVQRETAETFHMSSTFAHLHRASTFTSQAITFGGRIARNDITATLAGDGAEATLNGLYVADGDQLVDTHTLIDHAMPHCPSHEVYRGILSGRAKAVFNGKIIVRPDAQKTNAKQTNKALLLSGDATINTKPQLEIFADDVKCTHGATVGQLDDDQLFYLRARGIAKNDARNILIHAFASDVLNGIKSDAVRAHLEQILVEKLHLAT